MRTRTQIFAATWCIYASLYLARKPLSVVKPLLLQQGLDRGALGTIDTAFLVAYAFSQFFVGPLGDRYGAQLTLTVLVLATAVSTFLFSQLPAALLPLATLWLVNGACQSAAFPICFKALSPLYGPSERGAALGWWSTCQSVRYLKILMGLHP